MSPGKEGRVNATPVGGMRTERVNSQNYDILDAACKVYSFYVHHINAFYVFSLVCIM